MKHLTFKNGDKIPILGLGTWKSEPGEVKKAVYWAIEAGYRHIDCAAIYQNEQEVGEGIANAIKDGLVQRKDLFVTSKLWNNAHRHEDALPAIKKTLADLKLDYLDLYLVHWPIAFKPGVTFPEKREDFYTYNDVPIAQTWGAMQDLQTQGFVKHIGVSNFNREKLIHLMRMDGQIPEMNQVELHPFLPQEDLVQFCLENGILNTAYSPLGTPDSRQKKHEDDPTLMNNPVVKEIASRHGASEAQILIAWSIARGIAVIPKSTNKDRIKENFNSTQINLSDHDLMELRDIGVNHRYVDGSFFTGSNSPYSLSDLWDQ